MLLKHWKLLVKSIVPRIPLVSAKTDHNIEWTLELESSTQFASKARTQETLWKVETHISFEWKQVCVSIFSKKFRVSVFCAICVLNFFFEVARMKLTNFTTAESFQNLLIFSIFLSFLNIFSNISFIITFCLLSVFLFSFLSTLKLSLALHFSLHQGLSF